MRNRTKYGSVAAALVSALLLAACSSSGQSSSNTSSSSSTATSGVASSASTVDVNVGTSAPVKLSTGKLKIGIFMNGMTNGWEQALSASEEKVAQSYGWSTTLIDSNYDVQAQINALQNAATEHTYDAVAVVPIDGEQECNILTKTLPQANVIVTTAGSPICGRENGPNADMWAPGTLSHNSVTPSYTYDQLFLNKSAALLPGPQNVLLVVGAVTNNTSIVFHKLLPAFEAAHPDFKIANFVYTDFTTPTTYTEVQAYLQAHKNTTAILSDESPDITRGVLEALNSLGMSDVKVTDMGGDSYSVQEIKAGAVLMTLPYYPASDGAQMINSIRMAQQGKTPPRVGDTVPGGLANIPVVTKQSVATFQPQY
jgi:ribose transport system substrate-binding protein